MGRPPGLFSELSKWHHKAVQRGRPVDFNSDIIPDWFAAQVVAAMDTVGPDLAFSFLKQREADRMAIERRLKRKIAAALREFREMAFDAIAAGREPDYRWLFNRLRSVLEPEVAAMLTAEVMRQSGEIGIQFDPAVINVDAVRWARQYSGQMVQGVTDTTRTLVGEAVATFAETPGMTTGDVQQLLEPAFGAERAQTIAVTETTRAYSEAAAETQQMLNQTGLPMNRIWHTSADERVCDICGPLDGLPEQDWSQQFPSGPPAHPNCRCGVGLTATDINRVRRRAIERARDRINYLEDEGSIEIARERIREIQGRISG